MTQSRFARKSPFSQYLTHKWPLNIESRLDIIGQFTAWFDVGTQLSNRRYYDYQMVQKTKFRPTTDLLATITTTLKNNQPTSLLICTSTNDIQLTSHCLFLSLTLSRATVKWPLSLSDRNLIIKSDQNTTQIHVCAVQKPTCDLSLYLIT